MWLSHSLNLLQSQDERPFQNLPTLRLAELMTVFSNGFVLRCDCRTLSSWVRRPALKLLQKIPAHSPAALMVFSSSDSSLWWRSHILISDLISFSSKESPSLILPHILFKRVPSAEQASTSENDNEFSVRILMSFSSSGLALWRACHTLAKPVRWQKWTPLQKLVTLSLVELGC